MGLNCILPVGWLCIWSSHLQSSDAEICTWSWQKKGGLSTAEDANTTKPKDRSDCFLSALFTLHLSTRWSRIRAFFFFFFEVRISTRAETNREHKGCFKFGGKINELLCVWLLWSRAYSQTAWFQHVTRNGRPKEDACLRRSTLKVPLWKLTNAGDCCNLSTHQSAGDGLKHFENPLPKKKCLWLLWSEQTESMLLKSAQ